MIYIFNLRGYSFIHAVNTSHVGKVLNAHPATQTCGFLTLQHDAGSSGHKDCMCVYNTIEEKTKS